jgi:hypothetical protein
MTIKTRGSAALDKSQRRLASIASIDEYLDLGSNLTLQAYRQKIEQTRAALESYNTLLSHVDESRRTVTELEKELSEMSERMLAGIAVQYGRSSTEYSKAGGSARKGNTKSRVSSATSEPMMKVSGAALSNGSQNGVLNGNGIH